MPLGTVNVGTVIGTVTGWWVVGGCCATTTHRCTVYCRCVLQTIDRMQVLPAAEAVQRTSGMKEPCLYRYGEYLVMLSSVCLRVCQAS